MARKESVQRAQEIAGGFTTAKKNIIVQYNGRERKTDNILQLVRRDAIANGIKDEDIAEVDVYIKPEEQAIFYVINKEYTGNIAF